MRSESPPAPVVEAEARWQRCRLGDLVDDRGITYGVVQPGQPQPEGTPIIRVSNLTPAGLELRDVMRIDPAIAAKHSRSRLRGGEVVITLVGSVGQVAVVPPGLAGWNVARAVGVVPLRPEVPARWVAWCLRTPDARRYLEARLNTTVQSTLNLRDLASVEIPMPPPREQERIVSILGALDDTIDSNRRLAGLLEQVAAELFRARFVDFLGVEEFEPSALGPVPSEWKVGTLSDLVDVTMGQSPPGSSYSSEPDGGLPLVQGMGGFGARYPTSEVRTSAPTRRARAGVTLMTVRAPVGAVNIARAEVCLGRGVAGIDSEHQAFCEFLVRSLKDRWASEEAGTIFPAVNRKQIVGLPVVLPPRDRIADFDEFASPIVAKLAALYDESESLVAVRDLLLPKLVSGKIRIPDTARTDEGIVADNLVTAAS
jgi:type I restriction enzyme S subunit